MGSSPVPVVMLGLRVTSGLSPSVLFALTLHLSPNIKPQTMSTKTIAIRRRLIAVMSEGLASVSDEKFNRIARAVAYLSRRMERSVA